MMTKKNNPIDNDIFLSQWVSGELTDTKLKNLVSDTDYIAYKKLQKGLDVLSELKQPLDNSFKNIQHKISKTTKVRTLNYKWIASVAAMLIFFVGFYSLLGNDTVLSKSGFGEHKTVALLDGSEVILNAKSAINYSKKEWKNKRELYLNGEALFKVKKGSAFTVNTKNGSVTVLGTEFTVNSTPTYFEVICFSGQVNVKSHGENILLNPSDVYRKVKNNTAEKLTCSDKKASWIHGESRYRSVPLYQVINDLEKQYNITIDTKNTDNQSIFTGSFSHNDLDLALKSVFEAMDIKTKKLTDKLVVLE